MQGGKLVPNACGGYELHFQDSDGRYTEWGSPDMLSDALCRLDYPKAPVIELQVDRGGPDFLAGPSHTVVAPSAPLPASGRTGSF